MLLCAATGQTCRSKCLRLSPVRLAAEGTHRRQAEEMKDNTLKNWWSQRSVPGEVYQRNRRGHVLTFWDAGRLHKPYRGSRDLRAWLCLMLAA